MDGSGNISNNITITSTATPAFDINKDCSYNGTITANAAYAVDVISKQKFKLTEAYDFNSQILTMNPGTGELIFEDNVLQNANLVVTTGTVSHTSSFTPHFKREGNIFTDPCMFKIIYKGM